MPDIEDQIQKKKPFKKKSYRSYLSLDETLDDLSDETRKSQAIETDVSLNRNESELNYTQENTTIKNKEEVLNEDCSSPQERPLQSLGEPSIETIIILKEDNSSPQSGLQKSSKRTTPTKNNKEVLNEDRSSPQEIRHQSSLRMTTKQKIINKDLGSPQSGLQKSSKRTTKQNSNTLLNKISNFDLTSKHPLTGIKYGGYLPVRCVIFAPEIFTTLTPIDFKLFTYLTFLKWRYPNNELGHIRAALPYLAKGVNIARSAVFKHLKNLTDLHLITCVRVDHKLGNLYEVHDAALWTKQTEADLVVLNKNDSSPHKGLPQSLNETTSVLNVDYSSPFNGPHQSLKETKDLSPSNLFLSLSLSKFLNPTQLAELEARWMSFMKKEREREEKGLLKLFEQKPDEAALIFKAFDIVLKEQDEYGEIKSAISVLETNYSGQYRAKALAAIGRTEQKEKETRVKTETGAKQQEAEDAEGEMQLIRMQCFQEAFPDIAIRKQYILNICKESAVFSKFAVTSPIAVSHAVARWAEGEGSARVLDALDRQTSASSLNDAPKEEQ